MRKILLAFIVLFVLGFLVVLAYVLPRIIETSEITVNAGDNFFINLGSTPSTGYDWAPKIEDPSVVEYTGSTSTLFCVFSVMPGSSCAYDYNFRALKAGRTRIVMDYERSWEPNSTIRTKEYNITVR